MFREDTTGRAIIDCDGFSFAAREILRAADPSQPRAGAAVVLQTPGSFHLVTCFDLGNGFAFVNNNYVSAAPANGAVSAADVGVQFIRTGKAGPPGTPVSVYAYDSMDAVIGFGDSMKRQRAVLAAGRQASWIQG